MIRVTLELRSARGRRHDRRWVGTITNDGTASDGTGDSRWGNYVYELRDGNQLAWRQGRLTGFSRRRLMAWDLLCRVLRDAVGARNDTVELDLLRNLRACAQALDVAGRPADVPKEARRLMARADPR